MKSRNANCLDGWHLFRGRVTSCSERSGGRVEVTPPSSGAGLRDDRERCRSTRILLHPCSTPWQVRLDLSADGGSSARCRSPASTHYFLNHAVEGLAPQGTASRVTRLAAEHDPRSREAYTADVYGQTPDLVFAVPSSRRTPQYAGRDDVPQGGQARRVFPRTAWERSERRCSACRYARAAERGRCFPAPPPTSFYLCGCPAAVDLPYPISGPCRPPSRQPHAMRPRGGSRAVQAMRARLVCGCVSAAGVSLFFAGALPAAAVRRPRGGARGRARSS